MSAELLDESGKKVLNILKEKEKIILTSNKVKEIGKTQYAQVKHKTKKGLIPISRIRKPTSTDVLKEETIALENLDKLIKDIIKNIGPFNLIIKGDPNKTIYKNIVGVRNVSEKFMGREAKSDFNIVSDKGDAIFISHKKAGGAKAFQQYGGLSEKSGKLIYNHPEVQNFLMACASEITDNKLKQPMYSYIKDGDLINYAVFGSEYGKKFSIDNVTIIGQGDAIIYPVKGKDNLFELDFSDHLVHNGNFKEFMKGSYTAILGATFRSGRGFEVNGNKYIGARVGIYPKEMLIKRSGAKEI